MKKPPPNRPGLVLKQLYMEPRQMSTQDLANILEIGYRSAQNIISDRSSIRPEIALKLSKVFENTSPEYWINLQSAYDLWYAEGKRGSDDPFYQAMKISGEAILKLIGAKTHVDYESKAVVLKSKSLSPDIMAVPKDPDSTDDRIFIEFQAYLEEMIQYLTASKVTLSCAQDNYTGPVLAVIIYTDATYNRGVIPLNIESTSGSSGIHGKFKEIVLSEMKEEELLDIDSRLVLLAPFLTDSNIQKDKLTLKCSEWKSIAVNSYPDSMHHDVLNVLSLFILSKFKDISIKEVRSMLNFDLSDTRAGEELIEIGLQKGIQKGIQKGFQKGLVYSELNQRFGQMPVGQSIFAEATDEVINNLAYAMDNFITADDFLYWWTKNATPKITG